MKKIIFLMFRLKRYLSNLGLGKFKISYPLKHLWGRIEPTLIDKFHPTLVKIGGHKMFLDANDSLRLSVNENYEPLETDLVKKVIQSGDVVIDVGANIGYYTLIFAKLVGKNGKVYAFEPDPMNFNILKKNVEINGYNNVILTDKAVSNKLETTKLYLSKNLGGHRLYSSAEGNKFVEVQTTKLDDFFKDKPKKVNFIKLDIEGFEYVALKGMRQLIKKNNDIVIMTEFLPSGLQDFGLEPKDYISLLKKHKFIISFVDYEISSIRKITDKELLGIAKKTMRNQYITLCCSKKNKNLRV